RWTGFSIEPDLIKIGHPDKESPVFLTCNFNITVKRVKKALKGLNCYLLVAPSKGINVWCGACGDDFNTNSVISIIKTSGIEDLVSHRMLIVPQLSAPGIDPLIIKKELGWNIKFGPVYAKDIQTYLKNDFKKDENMRKVMFPISKRVEMANMYFLTIFIFFAIGFWITAIFLSSLNLFLFIDSAILMIIVIYGSLIILPSIKTHTGRPKVLIFEAILIVLIIVYNIFIYPNIFYLIWNLVVSILISLILIEDFHGLTPIYKSELGEKTWEKGDKEMRFMGMKIKLQPYGNIKLEYEKCIGCKVCIDVCPRNIYIFNDTDNKVKLNHPENCINCNACVKRCLGNCLQIA
ncbi:MAG: 4Fe-4S dicluster domain-containing protein, partial [Candidatus Lokiarchaeota archaeon]